MVEEVKTLEEFNQALQGSPGRTLVVFLSTKRCGQCTCTTSALKLLKNMMPHLRFLKVDVEDAPDVAKFLGKTEIEKPTFLVYKDEKQLETFTEMDERNLREKFVKYRF